MILNFLFLFCIQAVIIALSYCSYAYADNLALRVNGDEISRININDAISGHFVRDSNDVIAFRVAKTGIDIEVQLVDPKSGAIVKTIGPVAMRPPPVDEMLYARAVKEGESYMLTNIEPSVSHRWSVDYQRRINNPAIAAAISSEIDKFSAVYASNHLVRSGMPGRLDLANEAQQAHTVASVLDEEIFGILAIDDATAETLSDLESLLDYRSYAEAQLFASYGVETILDQASVRRLYDLSFSVCLLDCPDHGLSGTGFLVSSNIILTASHVLEGADIRTFIARFPAKPGMTNVDESNMVNVEIDSVLLDSQHAQLVDYIGKSGVPTRLDFSVIKLSPSGAARIEGYLPWDLKISNQLREPVYVLGYPGTDVLSRRLRVSDDCKIYFPYEVLHKDFKTLMATVGRELWPRCVSGQDIQAMREIVAHLQRQFKRSYGFEPDNPKPSYFYRGSIAGKADYPIMGIQSDTSRGFSGGPVCGKLNQAVYGVFLAGYDSNTDDDATWAQHERVMPIAEIVRAVTSVDPDFFAKYGIKRQ